MDSCLHRGSAIALIFFLLLPAVFPARAEQAGQPNAKPTLIVWAHTSFENQGAPTLDVLDLERYFVNALAMRRFENVVASSTVTRPRPSAPNTFLLEISADEMQVAERPRRNEIVGRYERDTLFAVELSLTIKELASGHVVQTLRSRAEHHFDPPEATDDVTQKRVAIYDAADRLANEFAGATAGQLGPAFTTLRGPLSLLIAGDKKTLKTFGIYFAAFIVAFGGLGGIVKSRPQPSRQKKPKRPVIVPPRPQDRAVEHDPAIEKLLKDLIALAKKTEDFSAQWIEAEARRNCAVLLRDAESIYARYAERTVNNKEIDAERQRVADYAARRLGLNHADIYHKLRRADGLQYDLLRAAQRITSERWPPTPPPPPPPPPRPAPPDPEKVEAAKTERARKQELEKLEHEKHKKQKELEMEKVDREIRDSRADLRAAPQPDEAARKKEEARRSRRNQRELKLDELSEESSFEQERISRARDKALDIYHDEDREAGERFELIRKILDSYNVPLAILPKAVREFMEEEQEAL